MIKKKSEKITELKKINEDSENLSLRPSLLNEFIGQTILKSNLYTFLYLGTFNPCPFLV